MLIKSFVFNSFYENTYIISNQRLEAFIFDPGCYDSSEQEKITKYITENNLKIKAVINTHCHVDHVLGNSFLQKKLKASLWISEKDKVIFDSVSSYAPQWGIINYEPAEVDRFIYDGDDLLLGELKFECIEVSGHTPGHLVFYERARKIMIAGDVLFKESIGRSDLPGGDHEQLLQNIKNKLLILPDDVVVYPGHGEETTIKHEKANNPFLK